MVAVSMSRISPSMMMFGAWRSIERRAGREGESHDLAHLHLVDAGQHIFNRVFDGDDLAVGAVDVVEAGVKRGGLARAGRAGDKENAVGQADEPLEGLLVVGEEAQLRKPSLQSFLVQNTHHDAFAVVRGQARDAQINASCRPMTLHLDAAVCGMRFSAMDMFA